MIIVQIEIECSYQFVKSLFDNNNKRMIYETYI